MLREEKAEIQRAIKGQGEKAKEEILQILSDELRQLKGRLTRLENKMSEKPAEKPKK